MTQKVLGINPCIAGLGLHDPSAALFEDGEVVYAAEEERFIRNKHAYDTFPDQAIEACLTHGGIELHELDSIAVPWEPDEYKEVLGYNLKNAIRSVRDRRFDEARQTNLKQNIKHILGYSKAELRDEIEDHATGEGATPPIKTIPHHRSHALSSFLLSRFEEALVVTIDGRGEYESTVAWLAQDGELRKLTSFEFPNSLGFFYALITEYLGYSGLRDEGKVMGLAPYGSPNPDIREQLERVITVDREYDVTAITRVRNDSITPGVRELESLFGRERSDTRESFSQWEKDLAYTAQRILEEIVTAIVDYRLEQCETGNVCLAGGVALNCKMNKSIMELERVDRLHVQPVAHDGGSILGAAASMFDWDSVPEMNHVYWGDSFPKSEIGDLLDQFKLEYEKPDDLYARTAELLIDEAIVGWFRGRMEMGPRALCNRSILADPRQKRSRDLVNRKVKHREKWRPFAPVILESEAERYLEHSTSAPYMIRTFDVPTSVRSEIPAVLHPADGTTRPQTVTSEQNEDIYKLLQVFYNRTGVPVLLNTSFNDSGEPIVRTPTEAIKMYATSGLDALVLDEYLITKNVRV